MSGPCSRRNAFSSVTSSPMNTAAEAPSWCRRMSSACPLSVWMTANSKTALPSVTCASQCCEAACAFVSAVLAVGGVGVAYVQRDAGRLDLYGDAGVLGGDRAQRVFDLAEQRLGRIVDRVNEAGVELGTVAADQMDLGGHPRQRGAGRAARGPRSARPSSRAGRPATRRAAADSVRGRASSGLATIGAMVPS